jgi:hypothetical protein
MLQVPEMRPVRPLLALLGAALSLSCQSLDRYDTKNGAAYCGAIVSGQFVRTTVTEGGFDKALRLRLRLDTDLLATAPGTLTTDDAADGPCAPKATFDGAKLRVTKELVGDALSSLTFEDGQVHNIVAWVDSTCRGPMLSIVSLYKDDRVEVRLLRPGEAAATGGTPRDAFALFPLQRSDTGCGY